MHPKISSIPYQLASSAQKYDRNINDSSPWDAWGIIHGHMPISNPQSSTIPSSSSSSSSLSGGRYSIHHRYRDILHLRKMITTTESHPCCVPTPSLYSSLPPVASSALYVLCCWLYLIANDGEFKFGSGRISFARPVLLLYTLNIHITFYFKLSSFPSHLLI